jgi:crossover junction endodeoxyribonuclease RuvC
MVKMLLGLDTIPRPHDATDALAVAICHLHHGGPVAKAVAKGGAAKSWRHYRP